MSRLRPFFSFYGSKWRLAPFYSPPIHDRVVECCAGSASYATLHHAKDVLLVDIDPMICSIWDFLIRVSEAEMLALPVDFSHVDELSHLCQEVRWFLGFWIRRAQSSPGISVSAWGREQRDSGKEKGFWSPRVRLAVARQLQHIRHWHVLNASYADIPEQRATYFVDPPYQVKGYAYRFSQVDFVHLAEWCKARANGNQVIACEAEGASWLPFRAFRTQYRVRGQRHTRYQEVVWEGGLGGKNEL